MNKHIGIDLGKESIMLSWPTDEPVKSWPVKKISYKDNWTEELLPLIGPGAIIVAEPTGINLITPLANVIKHFTTASLYLVNHNSTGAIRQEHVSRAKTDETDARTLALIATWVGSAAQPRSVREYNHVLADQITSMRLAINSHRQLTKQKTRLLNQLEALAFSMWPALAQHKSTWLVCVEAGAITPQEIIAIAERPPAYWNGQQKRYIRALADKLPDLPAHPSTRAAVLQRWTEICSIEPALANTASTLQGIIESRPFDQITKIWRSFPGTNDVYIASFHAACHGTLPETYAQFRALLGSNPQGRQSGKSKTTKGSRSGYKPAAAALHMWTLFLLSPKSPDNPIKTYAARKDKFALASARNKLAKILWICATRKEYCNW